MISLFKFSIKGKVKGIQILKSFSTMTSNSQVKDFYINAPFGVIAGKVWNENHPSTPILALHGWMDNAGTWDHLSPLLKNDYPIIAIDFPGHGLSSPLNSGHGTYFMDNLLMIQRVLNHFKINEVILLGHSMGGGAAMLYAGTFPETVKKLIVIDIVKPIHSDPENQPLKTAKSITTTLIEEMKMTTPSPKYSYEDMLNRMVTSYSGSLTKASAETLLKRGSRKLEDGSYSFTYSPMVKVPATQSLSADQQMVFASRIICDFLLIKSKETPLFSSRESCRSIIEAYSQASRNFILEVVDGTHHAHLNTPEMIAKLINLFLDDVPQSEESRSLSNLYKSSHL